jgi:AcrR family transcriptional regulator
MVAARMRTRSRGLRRDDIDRPPREQFLDAALRVLDGRGPREFSLRSVASEAHYSASAASYHLTPFDDFSGELWQRIATDMLGEDLVVSDHVRGDEHVARIERWSATFPHRARWFTSHVPTDRHLLGADASDASDATGEHADPRPADLALLRYTTRRVQAAVELLVTVGTTELARAAMTDALDLLRVAARSTVTASSVSTDSLAEAVTSTTRLLVER